MRGKIWGWGCQKSETEARSRDCIKKFALYSEDKRGASGGFSARMGQDSTCFQTITEAAA